MIIRLLLALIALVALMWFVSWYGKADAVQRNKALKSGLLYFIAIALLLLVVTGRIPWLFAGISAAIPFFMRLMRYKSIFKFFAPAITEVFGPSKLTTKWLIVEFDLSSRRLDGLITQGEFKNKKLSQLSNAELSSLLAWVADDFQSRAAVNAFILAKNGKSSQTESSQTTQGQISQAQAYEILGLKENAQADEIKKAHKRLMQKMHPDRGGSSYLAAQINAAKDKLLNKHV